MLIGWLGQWDSQIYTTDSPSSNVGILIRRLTNNYTAEQITTFCAEHGVDSPTDEVVLGQHSVPTDPTMVKACKIAYLGWYSRHGNYVVNGGIMTESNYNTRLEYIFTQQMIWEILGQTNGTFRNSSLQSQYETFKAEINQQLANIEKIPSFCTSTITVDAGSTTTLTDSNGVLKDYASIDKTVNGIRIKHTHGENTMQVIVDENCTLESYTFTATEMESYGLIKEQTRNHDTTVFITFRSGVQNQLYALNYNDPVTMSLGLKINAFGDLELSKLDTERNLIDGAQFRVTGPNNFNQLVTVTNGKIKLEKLRKGTYTIKEENAPTGYVKDTTTYTAEVASNETTTKAIVNEEPTGKILIYKVSNNKDKIGGAVFSVTASENITNKAGTKTFYTKGQEVGQMTTNSTTGIAQMENLPLGKYTVKEIKAPTGYLLNKTTYTAELVYKDQNTPVVELKIEGVVNEEPTGKILIYKVSENNDKIGGAVFKVTAAENITNKAGTKTFYTKGQEVDQITTDATTGIAQIDNLPIGKYNLKEIQAPTGYLLNENTYPANLEYKDQETPVVEIKIEGVVDEEPRGSIEIIKKDSETGSVPQGDATFVDAKYEVFADEDIYNVAKTKKFYSKGDLVATRTMDEKGTTENVTELPLGKYKVKEKVASKGYLIDTKEYPVNLEYKDQTTKIITASVTSYEVVKKMQIHIFKSGIKEQSGEVPGLEGAEFTIKLNSAVERAYSQGYSYAEVWNGIDEYGNKVDVDKNRVAKAQTIAPTYEVITTDKNGDAYTEEKLPYGKYIVKETVTPKDYESAADFTFSITEDESEVEEIAKKVKDLVVNNEQLETYIKLIKKDKETEKTVTLNSATFEIKATKDIYDRATGKIIYKKGEAVKQKVGSTTYTTFTTNADNIVIPDENSYNNENDDIGSVTAPLLLPVGSYEITEIRIPEGFLQLNEPVQFNIDGIRDYDKDQDGDYIKEVVIKNERPTGTLIVDKSIAIRENVDTSLIDTSDLSGIQFKLTAKEDVINPADGSVIYSKGTEINKYNLTKEGNLKVEKLPMGIYELEEIQTLDGLVLNTTKYEVKFIQKDQVIKVYEEKKDIENETTLVEFSKTDITGEKELEGATLSVIDENGEVVDSWISTDKVHTIEGLTVGKEYTLREEIAPDGYVRASEIKFTIQDTTEIQKVTMIDKIVEMSKLDIAGNEIAGAKMQVYDKEGNIIDEWTSTNEAHKIRNLVEGQTYILHEEIAPEGYVVAQDIEFTVTTDKETQRVELINKIVEMSKKDIGGEELEGAQLKVYDKEGNIIDEWTSTGQVHKIKNLREGETYTLHEEYAPEGYVIATEVQFTVTTDKETQRVELVNKVVEMSKKNIAGEELEGATIIVTNKRTKNIVDKWVSGKEAHKIKNLVEGETYIIHEEIAIDGYVKATDIEFTVTTDKETQKVEMIDKIVLVSKTDLVTGEELPGAELVVTDKDGNIIDEWISTDTPHYVTGLEEGKEYILTEITSPYGYEIAESITFTVGYEKENQLIEMKDMPILKNIKVVKLDSDTKEIIKSKFKFAIYEDPECTKLIKEVESNIEEGTAEFKDLRFGTYYIKETEAPSGYYLSEKIVKIVINDKGVFADDTELEEKDSVYSFEFYDTLIPEIQTGIEVNNILLISLMIISIIGITLGIVMIKRKNN